MKANFNDFISDNPNYSKFANSILARQIFAILSEDKNIIKMLEYADADIPPLFSCIKNIENAFDNFANPDLDLAKDFDRQGIGRMVKTVLLPFGYTKAVESKKIDPKQLGTKYFKTASRFKFDENSLRTMRVVKIIEEI